MKNMPSIQILEKVLSNTYSLYLKTQNYHWNVKSREFVSLHMLFEEQYNELAEAIDEIAERIRILGAKVDLIPNMIQKSSISLGDNTYSAIEMLKDLSKDQEILANILKQGLREIVEDCDDDVSVDILVQRLRIHQKNHWKLISSLE